MPGSHKTRLHKKSPKSDLDNVTRDPEYCITEIELLRGNLIKLGGMIDYVEMATHILSNLPK